MSTELQGFSARDVKPATAGGGGLPISDAKGWPMMILSDETKEASNNPNNGVLNLNIMILEGPHKDQEYTIYLNFFHGGDITERIAREKFSSICHTLQNLDPKLVSELYNKPFNGVVILRKGEPEGGQTDFKAAIPYESIGAGGAGGAGGAQQNNNQQNNGNQNGWGGGQQNNNQNNDQNNNQNNNNNNNNNQQDNGSNAAPAWAQKK